MNIRKYFTHILLSELKKKQYAAIPLSDYPVYEILCKKFGHSKSKQLRQPIDADGNPIPWYTYPATEYLRQLDLTGKSVFEFGSGNSTLFWCQRARHVTAVESNKEWYQHCNKFLKKNMVLKLAISKQDYLNAMVQAGSKFDIIIIDGDYRTECARACLDYLSPSGLIILDNADWFPETANLLRSSDLVQINFSGFGPINDYTWTTSLFITRSFNLAPCTNLPHNPIGGLIYCAEASDQ